MLRLPGYTQRAAVTLGSAVADQQSPDAWNSDLGGAQTGGFCTRHRSPGQWHARLGHHAPRSGYHANLVWNHGDRVLPDDVERVRTDAHYVHLRLHSSQWKRLRYLQRLRCGRTRRFHFRSIAVSHKTTHRRFLPRMEPAVLFLALRAPKCRTLPTCHVAAASSLPYVSLLLWRKKKPNC